ncbi:hypothetical protein R6Q59_014922 [Mikania micrantha]
MDEWFQPVPLPKVTINLKAALQTLKSFYIISIKAVFQYSSSHSVAEVNQASYQGCNTTNVLHPSSNGNTTFALTKPWDRYFVCDNRLHCYAGMKLHVVVDVKTAADGPTAGGPRAEPGGDSSATPTITTNTRSSKNNNPSSFVPSSVVVVTIGFKSFVFVVFTCLVCGFI